MGMMSSTAGPPRIGPYTVLTGLDDPASGVPVPEHRFIARSADGDRTVLAVVPRAGTDPRRFAVEAEASRYLLGPSAFPPTELAGPGEVPWHARPYLPVLPLPTVLAVHGGPLPEHTVRALGAALVETLAIGHGQGLTHAGLSPAAVLVAGDGPRLTCFGAVRAAAADGTVRSGLPGLESGSLPPEQATGGRPLPLGDLYALGAVLAYAATGHTVPEREAIPAALRGAVTACLSHDPAARPSAAALLDTLTSAHAASSVAGPQPTARSAALLGPGWLPGRVIAALARQSAAVLAAEIPAPEIPAPAAPPVPPVPPTPPAAPAHRQD